MHFGVGLAIQGYYVVNDEEEVYLYAVKNNRANSNRFAPWASQQVEKYRHLGFVNLLHWVVNLFWAVAS